METQQPPEDNHEAARIYAALGLVESRKRAEKPPRALFLIAASLRRSIRKNEKFIQTSTRKTTPTITDFHSSRALPSPSNSTWNVSTSTPTAAPPVTSSPFCT
ncbi:hypothetical protein CK203_083742 [Vitis vinifera]|uniref:Uncharacterized protein n=1 Tax=Vitis vinifera TaxID=29760 RepID=A0A438F0E3_VITVI|nr:hypothetical protein CK203_083742 [Vitis vinifera]